jgi:hypothetical protein
VAKIVLAHPKNVRTVAFPHLMHKRVGQYRGDSTGSAPKETVREEIVFGQSSIVQVLSPTVCIMTLRMKSGL